MSCSCSYGTSTVNGRYRRSAAEIAALDEGLISILREQSPITVRGAFYRAVAAGLVPKCESHGYRPVQRRLLKLREEHAIPHSAITDSSRMVRGHARYSGPDEFAAEVAMRYRRDYWAESDLRVEIWCEKDALSGVLYPTVVTEYGLDLYVTKGFSSVTYLQEAADDIDRDGRDTYVYLLTDFDPSGLSIAAAVEEELIERAMDTMVEVERIAVTRSQIDEYGLPTRPTKHSDTRAARFVAAHGTDSVELDAMPPGTLRALVGEAIERHMDPRRLRTLKMAEQEERQMLEMFSANWEGGGG